jgi:hypothetical protein
MKSFKYLLEKPHLVWILVSLIYVGLFTQFVKPLSYDVQGDALPEVAHSISVFDRFYNQGGHQNQYEFFKQLSDWGHLGYYVPAATILKSMKGNLYRLQLIQFVLGLLVLLFLLRLGLHFISQNRISPAWVSGALILLAINPFFWRACTVLTPMGLLLLLALLTLWAHESRNYFLMALFGSWAVTVDWVALVIPSAIVLSKIAEDRGRVLRPFRLLSFVVPFIVGAMIYVYWQGLLPQGDARSWHEAYRDGGAGLFRLDQFIYALAIFPVYSLWYSWSWAFKSRVRALTLAGVMAGLLLPVFFLVTLHDNLWEKARSGLAVPLGALDSLATTYVGEYRTLVFFLPYVAGAFLLGLLLFMETLDRSRVLRLLILLFFAVQPWVIESTESTFILIVPFISLFSLSEALVGEEGNLTKV